MEDNKEIIALLKKQNRKLTAILVFTIMLAIPTIIGALIFLFGGGLLLSALAALPKGIF